MTAAAGSSCLRDSIGLIDRNPRRATCLRGRDVIDVLGLILHGAEAIRTVGAAARYLNEAGWAIKGKIGTASTNEISIESRR